MRRITATIKNPTLANYLYSVIGIAWVCDKGGLSLRYVFPDELLPIFDNLERPKNASDTSNTGAKVFYIHSISSYMASTGRRAARKDLSADYGHRVLTQLSIRKDLQAEADEWFNEHLQGDWVAVHYRGTDMYTHPRFAERLMAIEVYIAYLKEVLDERCSIFACSDQAQFIEQIQHAFPRRVHYRDIKRSQDTQALHLQRDNRADAYRQKCDALIDVLIVSKATLVYTTGSQFIDITRYLNPNIKIISLNRRWERRNGANYLPIPQMSLLETLRVKQAHPPSHF